MSDPIDLSDQPYGSPPASPAPSAGPSGPSGAPASAYVPGTSSGPLPAAVPPPGAATAPAATPSPAGPAPAAPAAAGPAPGAPAAAGGPQSPLTAAGDTPWGRARAEGRSPVIEPGLVPALLTTVLALLLAAAAHGGTWALAAPLVVLQAVTAAGWFRLNGMWPARQGIALAFLGALAADASLLAVDRDSAPPVLLACLGVWVLLTVVLQLRSHADADERISGLMATVVSAALAVAAAGHLAADLDAVTVGGVAVAAAVLVRAVPLPTPVSAVLALAAAGAAGWYGAGLGGFGARDGALLALGAGLCALVGHRVASYDYPSRFVHMTAGVALPLTAAAPAVYVLGRVLG